MSLTAEQINTAGFLFDKELTAETNRESFDTQSNWLEWVLDKNFISLHDAAHPGRNAGQEDELIEEWCDMLEAVTSAYRDNGPVTAAGAFRVHIAKW